MEERACAKVNLFLRVIGRRADGYHLVDSLAVFPGAADVLQGEVAEGLSLRVTGRFGQGLEGEDNLVLRAARALQRAAWPGGAAGPAGGELGAALVLRKELPVASGIGGGSADAAAALRLLSRLWGLALPPAALGAIAAALGADVPVCLLSAPARMGGVGELLGAAPALPECGMVLVNPGVAVSTPTVFAARDSGFSAVGELPAWWPDVRGMGDDLAALGNDLEGPAIGLCPVVGETLRWLRGQEGCVMAQMSGSGATCYGLFPDGAAAAAAAAGVPAGWWGWGGVMAR